jgi:hypothetical protein
MAVRAVDAGLMIKIWWRIGAIVAAALVLPHFAYDRTT